MVDNPKLESSQTKQVKEVNFRKIRGLDGVPRSIVPIPYYKLLQPDHGVITKDQVPAQDGTFWRQDTGLTAEIINAVIVRAKRQVRVYKGDKVVSLNVLALNLDDKRKPFILNVPVTSFNSFGEFFQYLEDNNSSVAWEYPVTFSVDKRSKEIEELGEKKIATWYLINVDPGEYKVDPEILMEAEGAYLSYGTKLDRGDTVEENLSAEDLI